MTKRHRSTEAVSYSELFGEPRSSHVVPDSRYNPCEDGHGEPYTKTRWSGESYEVCTRCGSALDLPDYVVEDIDWVRDLFQSLQQPTTDEDEDDDKRAPATE